MPRANLGCTDPDPRADRCRELRRRHRDLGRPRPFGVTVEVSGSLDTDERVEIVRRRLRYEADPDDFAGNWAAARIRTRAGRRLDSPALIADGAHARADAYVSLAVVASAAAIAVGVPVADPLIGLSITLVILRITWESWRTVRGHAHT